MDSFFGLYVAILKKVWRSLAVLLVLIGISSLAAYANLQATKMLIDALTVPSSLTFVIQLAALLLGLTILQNVAKSIDQFINTKVNMQMNYELNKYLIHRLNFTQINQIEIPQYRNDLAHVRGVLSSITNLFLPVITILQQISLTVSYSVIVWESDWVLAVVVIATALPVIWSESFFRRKEQSFTEKTVEIQRKSTLSYDLMMQPENQKDIHIFSMKPFLYRKWNEYYGSFFSKKMKFERYIAFLRSSGGLVHPLRFFLIQIFLVFRIFDGTLTLGEYVSITSAAGLVVGSVSIAAVNISNMMRAKYSATVISNFIAKYRGAEVANPVRIESVNNLRISNLSFSYPNAPRPALRHIHLTANQGEVIAILGTNGSGKSTLGKIILGLYGVPDDAVFMNGHDINTLDIHSYYSCVSAVQQDYVRLPYKIYENITINDEPDESNMKDRTFLDEDLQSSLHKYAGNVFSDAKQMSGGQWQRLAIARAYYKQHSLIVLDEPSSHLDSQVEEELIRQMIRYKQAKITILITHSPKLAKYADKVLMLENGRMVAWGSHQELAGHPQYESYFREEAREEVVT